MDLAAPVQPLAELEALVPEPLPDRRHASAVYAPVCYERMNLVDGSLALLACAALRQCVASAVTL